MMDDVEAQEFECGQEFETNQVFPTRAELIRWVEEVAKKAGFVIIILRSDKGGDNVKRREYVTLGCERSGSYKKYVRPFKRLVTGTKKCECPFMLRGRPHANVGGGWVLLVKNGRHNHGRADVLVGHPYPSRLKPHEKVMVKDLTKNLVKPFHILSTIKDHDKSNVSTLKTIYNERQRIRRETRGSRSEIQQLMKMMDSEGYIQYVRRDEETDILLDIFWANPIGVRLYRTFNIVVVVDTTYKTNKYKLPLFEIVGITSTMLTFSIACAFLHCERADNFTWALHKLKLIVAGEEIVPNVIVSDRDFALVNAVREVFPTSKHLLCQYHIEKNVVARIKEHFLEKAERNAIHNAWNDLVNSLTENEYESRLQTFLGVCNGNTKFIDYCMNTWLLEHKEKFVDAWINKVMHLDTTTSNRVEGAHGKLKRVLQTSQGDMCKVWEAMHNYMVLQQNKIQASFQSSMIVIEHRYTDTLYCKLRGRVSRAALQLIHEEFKRTKKYMFDGNQCGCVLRKTHGLPCACELDRWQQYYHFIPLEEVNEFWKTLWIVDGDKSKQQPTDRLCVVQNAMSNLWVRYEKLDIAGQDALVYKINELAFPETTTMHPPPEKVKTKGRTSKKDTSTKRDPSYWEYVDSYDASNHFGGANTPGTSQKNSGPMSQFKQKKKLCYFNHLPPELVDYIDDVVDVVSDGNCGYRVIAAQLGLGEDGWPQVRHDLAKEMTMNKLLYRCLFGKDLWQEYLTSLHVATVTGVQPRSRWMTMPDMGHVIATRYQICLVFLTTAGSLTFFPLQARLRLQSLMTVAFVNGDHFVQVKLKDDCPLPPIHPFWESYVTPEAKLNVLAFSDRITKYKAMFSKQDTNNTPIDVDDCTPLDGV